ncbi:unnamed protein product [Ectocarpus sp. 6 AP-2014]
MSAQGGGGPAPTDPFGHCSDVVKRGDYDGYLYSLLQGAQLRPASLAIRAFNVETAAIKDSVRGNVMPGKMRMQWWKDTMADVFVGEPPPLPVALALAEVVANQKGGLTRRWFDRVLDARMADLDRTQPETLEEMETYAENTASSLLYLSLELAGVRAGAGPGAAALGHAAGHVGKAAGICTLLRSLALPPPPAALSSGSIGFAESCVLPSDVMRRFLLRHAVLERGPQDDKEAHALAECVFAVASVAKGHIEAAEEGLAAAREETGGKLPAGAFAALLPGVRVAWYLETLQACGFNAFDESLRPQSPFKFQLRLGRAMITEKF